MSAARAEQWIPDQLMASVKERSQYVRLMHLAFAGNADQLRQEIQSFDARVAEQQLRDSQHWLDDGTVADWPLLALVLRLRLTEVARVLTRKRNEKNQQGR